MASWPDRANLPEERLRMVLILGDPDEVGEQVQALLDAGLDALIVQLPNPGDLELLALAGETMSAAVAAPA